MVLALLITLLAGASIAIGALIVTAAHHTRAVEHFSIAIAFGAMAALAAGDLLPELIETYASTSPLVPIVCVVAGFALLKVLDLAVPHHAENKPADALADHEPEEHDLGAAHIGIMTAVALSVHNIVEGMSIYALAASTPVEGALYALGILLHNVPMGMLIFSTLENERTLVRHTTMTLVTVSTLVGGLVMAGLDTALPEMSLGIPLAVALGMIAYIVLLELLPRLVHDRPVWRSAAGAVIGFAIVMVGATLA